jgi:hypothetical protein
MSDEVAESLREGRRVAFGAGTRKAKHFTEDTEDCHRNHGGVRGLRGGGGFGFVDWLHLFFCSDGSR